MSGGNDTSTSTTTAPQWATDYAQNFLGQSKQVADLPYNGYSGQTVAQMNPFQVQGYNAQAARAVQGSPVNDAASGELQKTLNGSYLNSNPYLAKQYDSAARGITDNYNQSVVPQLTALDARSGSFGNSGVASATGTAQGQLAKNLGDVATNLYGNDYANERNRMQTAVSQAPTSANQDYVDASALQNAGTAFNAQDQANLTDQYQRFQQANNYPKDQLATLGKGLGFNYGSTTSQSAPATSPWATAIGTGASLYGAYKGLGSSTTSGGSGK